MAFTIGIRRFMVFIADYKIEAMGKPHATCHSSEGLLYTYSSRHDQLTAIENSLTKDIAI